MDLAKLAAAPRTLVLGGLAYKVGPLTMGDWGELQSWLKDNVPDPETEVLARLAKVKAMGIEADPADRQFLLREARKDARNWPPKVASPEWWDALARVDGGGGDVEFLWVLLRKHQPSITREQVAELAATLSTEDSIRLMYAAVGAEMPAPKAPAPTEGPVPSLAPTATAPPAPMTNGESSSTTSSASATSPTPISSP